MKITKNTVLKISGKEKSNTSYYQEHCTDKVVSKTLPLIENEKTYPLHYEIEIKKIYEDHIDILFNNEVIVPLYVGEDKYLVNENNTRGANDFFVLSEKYLSVSLYEESSNEFSHIKEFDNNSIYINSLLKKVDAFININNSYFDILHDLEIIHFQVTNDSYIKSVINSNNEENINRINSLLEVKDIIILLISEIKKYYNSYLEIFNIIVNKNYLYLRELQFLKPFLVDLINSNNSEDLIPFDLLYKMLYQLRHSFEQQDDSFLDYVFVKLLIKSKYYFKYGYVALRLSDSFSYNIYDKTPYDIKIEYYFSCAEYLIKVYDRPNALIAYEKANKLALENNDLDLASHALYYYYKLNNYFPVNLRKTPDTEYIKNKYKEYSDFIIRGINYKSLKVDPIEFSDEFISNFSNVMQLVEEEIDKVGDLHMPYQRWSLMQDIYLTKYNIIWQHPKQLNPRVMFD